jgi:hypothetical protein
MQTPPTTGPAVDDATPASPVITPTPLRLLATDESLACVDDLCLPADAGAPDGDEGEP